MLNEQEKVVKIDHMVEIFRTLLVMYVMALILATTSVVMFFCSDIRGWLFLGLAIICDRCANHLYKHFIDFNKSVK